MGIGDKTLMEKIDWDSLYSVADRYRKNAYAPYSHFQVGAAVLGNSGEIYGGCNVENASYGLTQCAERNAISAAVGNGETEIKAILILTDTDSLTAPCGACRQFIYELGSQCQVRIMNTKGQYQSFLITALLPEAFDSKYLPKE